MPIPLFVSRRTRLERALDALASERQRVQRDLQLVDERRRRLTGALSRLGDCRATVSQTPFVDDAGSFDRGLYLVARTAEARMTRELDELGQRLGQFDREITDPVRERLKEASQRERAVDTLLERRRNAERLRRERRESRELDEFAQRTWRDRRRG